MALSRYLVVGPESSGNRYLFRLLVHSGCRPLDYYRYTADGLLADLPDGDVPAVALRSLPHAGLWPDLHALAGQLGGRLTLVVPRRAQECVEQSQVAAGHVGSVREARRNIARAYGHIFSFLADTGTDYVVADYHRLGDDEYVDGLGDRLGIVLVRREPFVDGNLKYRVKT